MQFFRKLDFLRACVVKYIFNNNDIDSQIMLRDIHKVFRVSFVVIL